MQGKYRNFEFYRLLFSVKIVSSSYDSVTLSQIVAQLSIVLAKYFPFHNYM